MFGEEPSQDVHVLQACMYTCCFTNTTSDGYLLFVLCSRVLHTSSRRSSSNNNSSSNKK